MSESFFDAMSEQKIMELVRERGLPGLKAFCKSEEDLERLVDIVEKNIGEIFPGMVASKESKSETEKDESSKAESEKKDNTEGKLLSDEEAKLDTLESDMEKQAAADKSEERRQQQAAWKRIKDKGDIPIKFEGDQNTPPDRQKRKILFLCSDNSCISQMAEAWTLANFSGGFDCASAGFEPKPILDPLAVAAMMAQDVDICSWKTKSVAQVKETQFDLICPLDDVSHIKAKEVDWKGAQLVGGKFDLPTIEKLNAGHDERIAARKARRAIRELERRREQGEKIEIEDLLKEVGLEERLAAEDSESDHESDDQIDPRIRLMPDYRDLSEGIKGFVESIPQILAFLATKE